MPNPNQTRNFIHEATGGLVSGALKLPKVTPQQIEGMLQSVEGIKSTTTPGRLARVYANRAVDFFDWLRAAFQPHQPENVGRPSSNWLKDRIGGDFATQTTRDVDEESKAGLVASALGGMAPAFRKRATPQGATRPSAVDKALGFNLSREAKRDIAGSRRDVLVGGHLSWDKGLTEVLTAVANNALVDRVSPMVKAVDLLMEHAGIPERYNGQPIREMISQSFWHEMQNSFWVTQRPNASFSTQPRPLAKGLGSRTLNPMAFAKKQVEFHETPEEAVDFVRRSSRFLPRVVSSGLSVGDYVDGMLRLLTNDDGLRASWGRFVSNQAPEGAYQKAIQQIMENTVAARVKGSAEHALFSVQTDGMGNQAYTANPKARYAVMVNGYDNLRWAAGRNRILPGMSKGRADMLIEGAKLANLLIDPNSGQVRQEFMRELPPYFSTTRTDAATMLKLGAAAAEAPSTLQQQALSNSFANTLLSSDPAKAEWFSRLQQAITKPMGIIAQHENAGIPLSATEFYAALKKEIGLDVVDLQGVNPYAKKVAAAWSKNTKVVLSEMVREMYGMPKVTNKFVLPTRHDMAEAFKIAKRGRANLNWKTNAAVPSGQEGTIASHTEIGDAAEQMMRLAAEDDMSRLGHERLAEEMKPLDEHPSDAKLDRELDAEFMNREMVEQPRFGGPALLASYKRRMSNPNEPPAPVVKPAQGKPQMADIISSMGKPVPAKLAGGGQTDDYAEWLKQYQAQTAKSNQRPSFTDWD